MQGRRRRTEIMATFDGVLESKSCPRPAGLYAPLEALSELAPPDQTMTEPRLAHLAELSSSNYRIHKMPRPPRRV